MNIYKKNSGAYRRSSTTKLPISAKTLKDTNSVVWKYKIPDKDFLSNLKFGNDEIPYATTDNEEAERFKPTQEQLKEFTDFLNQITKGDCKYVIS